MNIGNERIKKTAYDSSQSAWLVIPALGLSSLSSTTEHFLVKISINMQYF